MDEQFITKNRSKVNDKKLKGNKFSGKILQLHQTFLANFRIKCKNETQENENADD